MAVPTDLAPEPRRGSVGESFPKEILNIDEAAFLLGVSVKTFNKVLHSQSMPARKIGREWKFSRQALIEWVGSGRSDHFYKESPNARPNAAVLSPENGTRRGAGDEESRRTSGWRLELD